MVGKNFLSLVIKKMKTHNKMNLSKVIIMFNLMVLFVVIALTTTSAVAEGAPLSAVYIVGTAKEGQTLRALVSPSGATVTYQWQAGGNIVGTNSAAYIVQEADMGKTITLTVTGTGSDTGTITSSPTSSVTESNILVKINGGDAIGGDSFWEVFKGYNDTQLSQITSIEVIKGSVVSVDWEYMRYKNRFLYSLKNFIVADTVTSVADLPIVAIEVERVFNSSSLETVSIAKLASVPSWIFKPHTTAYTKLTTVKFPDATSIGQEAFYNCAGIKTVQIPNVTSIEEEAFYGCTGLTIANFPKTQTIGKFAFYNCSFGTANFPEVTSIAESAFHSMKKLMTANFPAVTSIEQGAFNGCNSLTTVNAPLVTSVGGGAFYECSSLTTVEFPLVSSIGYNGFSRSGLTTVDFPLATSTGERSFYECTRLTTVNFPDATSIGNDAFSGCTSLTTVNIPKATNIGHRVFSGCISLTAVDFPLATSIGVGEFSGCIGLTEVKFPVATVIRENAFYGCTNLTTASFPVVTSIGDSAFYLCSKLSNLKLPAIPPTVTKGNAFAGCPEFRTLSIVDTNGIDLTGEALTTAQGRYKASNGYSWDTWYGWYITQADGPALTGVESNDAANRLTGMTADMEFSYSTDGTTWTPWTAYNAASPNLPDLTGTVALQIRVAKTATHTAGAPTTFYFTVPTLSGIAITTPATKTVYKIGEILDITGMVVTGTYSDNSTKEETITSATVSGFDSSAVAATQTLTVTVGGKTVTYTIAVVKVDNPIDWKVTIPAADREYTYSGGTGADEMHPYMIDNSYDLAMLAANVNAGGNYSQGKFFKLTADIVLNDALDGSPKAWMPIGVYALNDFSRAFKGSFDGNGHTIKGVYIDNSHDHQGLFGFITAAAVKNVGVIGSSISGKTHVGGIVGSSSGSRVENCYNTSPVAGDSIVGGLVGGASNGNLVKNCYNTNAVTGTGMAIGGVAGMYTGGSVENCYNTGNISGANLVGGVVGILQGGGTVKNCVSLGQMVNGTSPVGRVISGLGTGGTVTDSYARKDMKIGATGSEAIVTGGAADNQNGADLTVSTATPQAWGTWFSDTAAWDITGVGNLVGGANLPILKDFSAGQNPTLPGSIQAGTYTLTVNLDGGNSGITGGNYIAGAVVAINAGTKADYTFSGWTTSNGGTFEKATLTSTNFTMPANEVTITAHWIVVPTTPTYTVSGTIKDTNNNPVSGATVTLTDPKDSSKKYTGTTDANGNYSIPGVPNGNYTVSVTKCSETLGSGSVTVNGSNVSGGSGNITVNPPTITTVQTPVFSASNVRGIEAVTQSANATELSVTAAVTDSGTISYQWYKNTTNSTTGGTPISGATSSSYTPPTDTVGTTYYYVVVTNTATVGGETKTSTNTSSIKKVIVLAAPAATYDVSASGSSLSNITLNNTSATQYQNYTTTLSAASGYTLPSSITITMGGVTLVPGVDYIYSKVSSVLTVYNVTGELSITAVGVLIPTQTYTITFNTNGGSNVGAMSGTYGTAISLPTPTKPGYDFAGWYKDSSFATSYLATTMGAENITLHAKWEQLTYTVTGNVKDENNANVDSATVKLMAGSRKVAQATTDVNGVFSISGIPSGIYNLVISKGIDQIITLTITVSGDIATGSVTLPKGKKNSVVEVKSGTLDIIVDKLNDFFASNQFTRDDSNVIDAGGTVEIRLIVEQRVESGDNAAENAQSIIAAAGSGKEIGIFLNLSLSKIVTPPLGGTAERPISITELEHPLIIDIPLPAELQGKNNYVVYRYHGTEVQTITQTNADAEYIELSADGKSIKLHTKKFSTYAIGYTAASTPSKDDDGNDGGTTTAPTITADSNAGGKVTISSDQKTATIIPEEGYIIFDVLVDGKSVGAIATYTFADSEKHKIRAIFVEKTGVKRLAGVNRVDTALEIAKASYEGKVPNVVLATAENYPDALAGSILASKNNAPLLLVGTDADDQQKVLDYVQSNLEATGTIYILGGFATVSQEIESSIKALGFGNIIRLGGKDRYETSAMIAVHMIKDNDGTPIVITTGEDYPDALSISSIASRHQYPILLTAKNQLSSAVKQKIQDIKPSKIYLIGLEGSINPSVEEEIQQTAALAKGSIIRIGGEDRFETSLAIAKHFKQNGNYVSIATGNNFPDALSGSLYAARMNAPILLVNETISDQMTSYFKEEGIKGATIFGGEAVVGKKIFEELTNLVKP